MKTPTQTPDKMDVVRYTIAGIGFLGIMIALIIFETTK